MPSPAWRALYDTAERFRQLAPWSWMYDADVFGVRDPESGEVGWCSVLGNANDVLGLAIYRGDYGYDQLLGLLNEDDDAYDSAEYGLDAILVLFCDRREVDRKQLSRIRALGLQPNGSNAWPVFDDHRPGHDPVALTQAEVPFCTVALQQAMVMAERLRVEPKALDRKDDLVLVRELDASGTAWTDTWVDEPLPPSDIDDELAVVARHLTGPDPTRLDATWECDLFPMAGRVDDGDGESYTPALFMVTDAGSGMVLRVQLGHPDVRHDMARYELMLTFGHFKGIPARVLVAREEVELALAPLVHTFRFELVRTKSLPRIEEARASFEHALGGPGGGGSKKRKRR